MNQAYLESVKPIFKIKCFDCHSNKTQYPWYYRLPFVKKTIDQDIQDARRHLNLSNDFPFGGHGTPKQDLEAIRSVLQDNSMPPLRYKIMHWNSELDSNEK
ncbi:MAG: heme-binding domain-containing protein, partial [Proteobacteria bacterium]|nr:heme-binding domain-containing protein [Pseudomonadota bacterium]